MQVAAQAARQRKEEEGELREGGLKAWGEGLLGRDIAGLERISVWTGGPVQDNRDFWEIKLRVL